MVFIIQDIIFLVTVGKTVNKNLVHHGAFCPFGRRKARTDTEAVLRTDILRHAKPVEIDDLLSAFDFKIVGKRCLAHADLSLVIIKLLVRAELAHHNTVILIRAQPCIISIVTRRPQDDPYRLPCLRLHRNAVFRRPV